MAVYGFCSMPNASDIDDAGAGAADALGPGEGGLGGLAGDVLLDGDEGGDALAFDVLGADDVARALGGDHGDVDVLGGLDQLVVDREAVDEEDGLATLAEVRGDVLLPDGGLLHVGDAEERAAAFIAEYVTKPVVGYVAGFTAPEGKTMGHAGAIVSGSSGTAQGKKDALEAAGVKVGQTPSETARLLRAIMGR